MNGMLTIGNYTIAAGPHKDYSAYQEATGVVGKTIEAVLYSTTEFRRKMGFYPGHTIITFTDGTYFECETWAS